MTKIVKSMSVVDDRPLSPPMLSQEVPRVHGVIKRQALGRQAVAAPAVPLPVKDAYLDELNRLRVEIRQAKEELRGLGSAAEEARRANREPRQEEASTAAEDVRGQAEAALAAAQAQAGEILARAEEEGRQLAEEARNNGYLEGFSKGFEEAGQEFQSEYGPKMVQIAEILDRLADLEEKALREHEKELVELSLAVARKIMGQALGADPAVLVGLLRGLVEENSRAEYVKITLSPDLLPIDAKASAQVRALLGELGANVSLATDASMAAESATVETPKGVVDVSIATQLSNLKSAILEK